MTETYAGINILKFSSTIRHQAGLGGALIVLEKSSICSGKIHILPNNWLYWACIALFYC